jgi:hypothetical protein
MLSSIAVKKTRQMELVDCSRPVFSCDRVWFSLELVNQDMSQHQLAPVVTVDARKMKRVGMSASRGAIVYGSGPIC